MIEITIPCEPPSVGHYLGYRAVAPRGGGRPIVMAYKTAAAKDWIEMVKRVASGFRTESEDLEVAYIVYQSPRSRADVDNYGKMVCDGLTDAGVIKDDRYVRAIHGFKVRDRSTPRTVVYVREMPVGALSLFPTQQEVERW